MCTNPIAVMPQQQDMGAPEHRFQWRPIFNEKQNTKPFPYLTRQVPKSWHMSNGTFHMHGMGKHRIKFLDYSACKEYLVQPDIVEFDGTETSVPGFDLILGTNTLKELGIVLNF